MQPLRMIQARQTHSLIKRIEQAKESAQTLENNGITYDSSAKKFIFADDAIATRLSLEGVHKRLANRF